LVIKPFFFFVVKIFVITICDDEGVAEPPWQRMEESKLQIKNLTITHIKDNRILLQDLSFVLNKGDKVAIIGEEGNGKSSLLKLIYDEKLVEGYTEYTGEIIKNQACIGYLPQEISGEDKALSAYEFIAKVRCFTRRSQQNWFR